MSGGDGPGWLAADYPDGFCLTFARGLDTATCLDRLGAELSEARPQSRGEVARLDSTWDGRYGPMARAGTAGDWAFTLELASFEGARPEVLRRVSAGTTAGCVFSDIEGATGFGYAENGTVRARLDDLLDPAEQGQVGLGWPLAGLGRMDLAALEAELGPAGPLLVLVGDAFGLRLHPDQLDEQPLLAGRLIAVLGDLPGDGPEIGSYSPEMDAAVAAAAPSVLRAAMAGQARAMAAEAALAGPELASTLAALATGPPRAVTDESAFGRLVRMLKWEQRVAQCARLDSDPRAAAAAAADQHRRHRFEAAHALRVAQSRPPRAGLGAVLDVRARWAAPSWRAELLTDLRARPPAG